MKEMKTFEDVLKYEQNCVVQYHAPTLSISFLKQHAPKGFIPSINIGSHQRMQNGGYTEYNIYTI